MCTLTTEELKKIAVEAIDRDSRKIIGIANTILNNPETGFNERKTAFLVQKIFKSMGIPFRSGLAITGVKGFLEGKAGLGPAIAVIGELDSIVVQDHPYADKVTGAAHACGHHCQIASMVGAMVGLSVPKVLNALSGKIVPFAVPAEELIQVKQRLKLRSETKIEFMGGKQELIRLGEFDDIDMAMLCHTNADRFKITVGGTSNAHIVKYVEFTGKATHSGATPYLGVNALNAAMFSLSAIHAIRETFREKDVVRSHGVMTNGGEAVNAVPDNVILEWRIRSGNSDALLENSAKIDRCFKAGALALGAKVEITNVPGYMPMRNNMKLQELFHDNAVSIVGEDNIRVRRPNRNGGGSTDMGDLSHFIPVIHPYSGGATGVGHASNYVVEDYEQAVINPAKIIAMTVIDLLSDGAIQAREIDEDQGHKKTKEQYVDLQRRKAKLDIFDGNDKD